MGLIAAWGLLASVALAQVGALNVEVDGSKAVPTGWLEYSAANTNFPQCCDGPNCKMVRIAGPVIDAVKNSGLIRSNIQDSTDKIKQAFVSYDHRNDGLFGKLFRGDGSVQTLAPVDASDKTNPLCLPSQHKRSRFVYHKLYTDGKYSSLPAPLLSLLQSPAPSGCCAEGSTCSQLAGSVSEGALVSSSGSFRDLYVPRNALVNLDSELFKKILTQPRECQDMLCDVYIYANAKNEQLKIGKTKSGVSVFIDGGNGASSTLVTCETGEQSLEVVAKSEPALSFSSSTSGRVAPGDQCWFPYMYCNPLKYSLHWSVLDRADKSDAELIQECYDLYINDGLDATDLEVTQFSIHFTREDPNCYLLGGCERIVDDVCIELGKCVSGPAGNFSCADQPPVADCPAPPELGPGILKWQCVDRFGERVGPFEEGELLPPFTTCVQACNSWTTESGESGYLSSTCQIDGTWSSPEVLPPGETLAHPEGPYPTPGAGAGSEPAPLTCGCPDLPLLYNGAAYNPNVEEGADFVCDSPPVIGPHGEITIVTGNQCYLYCDDVLALSTKCVSDSWTGNPERGFYCFYTPGSTCATLYDDHLFSGASNTLTPCSSSSHMAEEGWNDKTSSVSVTPNCTLRLWDGANYLGPSQDYQGDVDLPAALSNVYSSYYCFCEDASMCNPVGV